jgi:hypothetical protein
MEIGLSILRTSLGFCFDVAEHLDGRILDKLHSKGTPGEIAGASPHFLYGQDPGFRDLYVGASCRSHQQRLCLVPQQHTAQAHLDLSKSKLHHYLLSNPRFKCILHVAPEVFL